LACAKTDAFFDLDAVAEIFDIVTSVLYESEEKRFPIGWICKEPATGCPKLVVFWKYW
jgi:hypothetical protein